jgi:hypothetical protein
MHTGPHTGPHKIPKIDGALDPAAIPDETAELMFLRTAFPKPGDLALNAARAYLRDKLKIIDRSDTAEINRVLIEDFLSIVRDYNNRLNRITQVMLREAIPQANAGIPQATAQFAAEERQLLGDFRKAMADKLGQDGQARMEAALTDVKKKTRIF